MTEARGSSRRRLAFTTPPVSQSTATACSLCNQVHTTLSSPISWRDECCRELALTLGITEQSLVCRPCRNDITRLRKDPCHIPRWEKERVRECAVSQCKNNFFSKCNIPMSDIVHCNPEIILKPVDLYGWKIEGGKLEFDWDSDANIQRVQTRVQGLLKGCKCTKGCKTNACGCKRRGQSCTEGCQCQECGNLPYSLTHTSIHSDREEREQTTRDYEDGDSSVEYDSDASIDEQHEALDAEVSEIMRSVFGNDSDEECD